MSGPTGLQSVWSHDADMDLIWSIADRDQDKNKWVAVKKLMDDRGYSWSSEALRKRAEKLKKESDKRVTSNIQPETSLNAAHALQQGTTASKITKATANKRKGAPGGKAHANGKAKTKRKQDEDEDGNENESANNSPASPSRPQKRRGIEYFGAADAEDLADSDYV